jgi:hypothetical protein
MQLGDYVFLKSVIPLSPAIISQVNSLITSAKDVESGVELKDRTVHLKKVKQSFVAREFITWICTYLNVERYVGLRIALFLQQHGYLKNTSHKDQTMRDDTSVFCFNAKTFGRKRSLSVDSPSIIITSRSRFLDVKTSLAKRISNRKSAIYHKEVILSKEQTVRVEVTVPEKPADESDETLSRTPDLVGQLFGTSSKPQQKALSDGSRTPAASWSEMSDLSACDIENEICDLSEYEIKVSMLKLDNLEPLQLNQNSKNPIKSKPYCKIFTETQVHTTEPHESLKARWFSESIVFKVTTLPASCVFVALEQTRADTTDGGDLYGYFDVVIEDQGSLSYENIRLVNHNGIPSGIATVLLTCNAV